MEITVSNKMKTANFNAVDEAYAFIGNYAANNENVLTSMNGQVRKNDNYIGIFDARLEGEVLKFSISNMDLTEMRTVAQKLDTIQSMIEAQLPDSVEEE